MQDNERANLVEVVLNRLNLANFGIKQVLNVQETSQEVSCLIDNSPVLVFLVESDKVTVIKTGTGINNGYEQSFNTKLQLLLALIQILWSVYVPFLSFSSFLSIITGSTVKTWVSFLARLVEGLDLDFTRVKDGVQINQSTILVHEDLISYKGVLDVKLRYDNLVNLATAVVGFLDYELSNADLDIIIFDNEDELLGEEEPTDAATPSAPAGDFGSDDFGDEPLPDEELPE